MKKTVNELLTKGDIMGAVKQAHAANWNGTLAIIISRYANHERSVNAGLLHTSEADVNRNRIITSAIDELTCLGYIAGPTSKPDDLAETLLQIEQEIQESSRIKSITVDKVKKWNSSLEVYDVKLLSFGKLLAASRSIVLPVSTFNSPEIVGDMLTEINFIIEELNPEEDQYTQLYNDLLEDLTYEKFASFCEIVKSEKMIHETKVKIWNAALLEIRKIANNALWGRRARTLIKQLEFVHLPE